jgi:hypothetical protein
VPRTVLLLRDVLVDPFDQLLREPVPLVNHWAEGAVPIEDVAVRVPCLPKSIKRPLHVRRHAEAVHGPNGVHDTGALFPGLDIQAVRRVPAHIVEVVVVALVALCPPKFVAPLRILK